MLFSFVLFLCFVLILLMLVWFVCVFSVRCCFFYLFFFVMLWFVFVVPCFVPFACVFCIWLWFCSMCSVLVFLVHALKSVSSSLTI